MDETGLSEARLTVTRLNPRVVAVRIVHRVSESQGTPHEVLGSLSTACGSVCSWILFRT
jgi:hypothetical protein